MFLLLFLWTDKDLETSVARLLLLMVYIISPLGDKNRNCTIYVIEKIFLKIKLYNCSANRLQAIFFEIFEQAIATKDFFYPWSDPSLSFKCLNLHFVVWSAVNLKRV